MGLTGFLNSVVAATSMEELWDQYCVKLDGYGFDRVIYGFTRSATLTSPGSPMDFVFLTNHSTEFADTFINQGLYNSGPMVRWGMNNFGTQSWSIIGDWLVDGSLSQDELSVLEINRSFDVTAGYSHSIASTHSRARSGFAMAGRKDLTQNDVDQIWAEHGEHITLINNVVHLKLTTLPYTGARQLTKRQREVLEWVGDGKTIQDIAMVMGLTGATVEKHLRLARESLQVETTAQAVLKASFQNQMYVVDL